jgi:beta-lactamase class A
VGEVDLDEAVPVHNVFSSAADGSAFSLDREDEQDDEAWNLLGATAMLRDLALRAVGLSGTLATNLLLERVGAGEVAAVLADAGCGR